MSALGNARRHRRRWPLGVGIVAVATLVFVFVFPVGRSSAVTSSPSGFESADGNMTLSTVSSPATNTDWNCFVGTDNFQSGTTPAGCKVTSGAVHVSADKNGEVEWVSGQKFDNQCPKLTTGNNPPKDEFTDVASYNETAASGDVFFYGATMRSTANGNASGDVEFDQQSGDGTTNSGCRVFGDRLLEYNYLNGGTSLSFDVITWIDNSKPGISDQSGGNSGKCLVSHDSMPCWGANDIKVMAGLFDGQSNNGVGGSTGAIAAGDNGISGTALAINQFAEFGINLSQALGLGNSCVSYPQQEWESRSSGSSFTSNPEDIEIEQHTIQTCGEIRIIKQSDPRGQNQAFSFESGSVANTLALPANTSGGVACTGNATAGVQADGSFCLNDSGNAGKTLGSAAGADNSTGNTIDVTNVPHGTYSVSENSEPGSFGFESLTCSADTTSGSSVSPSSSTSNETATITLSPNGIVTCVYVNKLQPGAIVITKAGKDKNCTGANTPTISEGVCTDAATADLSGATFDVSTDAADQHPATGGTGLTTGSDGTVCIDGLPWSGTGTTYYVTETAPPTGFALPSTVTQSVSVSHAATCSPATGTPATISFTDQPKTDVTVSVSSEVAGASNSTVSCVITGTASLIGNSPQPSTGKGDPETLTANGLIPGSYTCTVVIDP